MPAPLERDFRQILEEERGLALVDVERERADPRAVAPPITIAVDDKISMPPTA